MARDEERVGSASGDVRVIAFETARVERFGPDGPPMLIVTGTAPCLNMELLLTPLTYDDRPEDDRAEDDGPENDRPEYWGIEVTGKLRGPCEPGERPYAVSISLIGFARPDRVDGVYVLPAPKDVIGSLGIEVIGTNGTERIRVEAVSQEAAAPPS